MDPKGRNLSDPCEDTEYKLLLSTRSGCTVTRLVLLTVLCSFFLYTPLGVCCLHTKKVLCRYWLVFANDNGSVHLGTKLLGFSFSGSVKNVVLESGEYSVSG